MTRRELFTLALGCMTLRAQRAERPEYLSLSEARPILEGFSGELPSGLDAAPDAQSWLKWETARDQEIRSRLKRGDADSIVNLVLFGTSFTARPRLTAKQTETGDDSEAVGRMILARIQDFAKAVLHPGRNERLQFAAAWLKESGIDPTDPAADKRIVVVLLENTRRVLREQSAFNSAIDSAKKQGDAGERIRGPFKPLSRSGLVAWILRFGPTMRSSAAWPKSNRRACCGRSGARP